MIRALNVADAQAVSELLASCTISSDRKNTYTVSSSERFIEFFLSDERRENAVAFGDVDGAQVNQVVGGLFSVEVNAWLVYQYFGTIPELIPNICTSIARFAESRGCSRYYAIYPTSAWTNSRFQADDSYLAALDTMIPANTKPIHNEYWKMMGFQRWKTDLGVYQHVLRTTCL